MWLPPNGVYVIPPTPLSRESCRTKEEGLYFDARIASEPNMSVRIFGADLTSLSLARLQYVNLAIIVFIFRGSNISVQSLLRLA